MTIEEKSQSSDNLQLACDELKKFNFWKILDVKSYEFPHFIIYLSYEKSIIDDFKTKKRLPFTLQFGFFEEKFYIKNRVEVYAERVKSILLDTKERMARDKEISKNFLKTLKK